MKKFGYSYTDSWSQDDCYNSRHHTIVLSMKKGTGQRRVVLSIYVKEIRSLFISQIWVTWPQIPAEKSGRTDL